MNFQNENSNMEMIYGVNDVTPEKVRRTTVLIHNVTKLEVQKKDYMGIAKLFKVFKELKTEARGKLMLQFAGYEDTPDEIYEIKEIRDYVMGMFQRWPEMFYYITQNDINYKIILACIVDVEIVVQGTEKKGIDRAIFEGTPMTPVQFTLSIPENIKQTIQTKIGEYGRQIGENEKILDEWIENLIDPTKGVRSNYEEYNQAILNTNLIEAYQTISADFWKAFIQNKKDIKIIQEHKLLHFIKKNEDFIQFAIDSGRLMTMTISHDKFTNVFIVKDKAHGPICPTCHSSTVIVFKKNMFSSINECVFLPSIQNYIQERVIPLSERFMNESPVPVNIKVDKWVCPHCLKVQSFKSDSKNRFRYV